MNERIRQALDGEVPVGQLTAGEAAEYRQHAALYAAALDPLKRVPDVDVSAAVLRRIEALPPAPAARAAAAATGLAQRIFGAAAWLWSPRPVALTLRPAFGFVAVLALAATLWIAAGETAPAVANDTAEPPSAPNLVLVQFRLGDAEAREVALVGDFNAWTPEHRLHEIAPGVWSVVVALEPGVYNYGFVVNGETWRLDPLAPQIADGFGGASSRVSVLTPERRT